MRTINNYIKLINDSDITKDKIKQGIISQALCDSDIKPIDFNTITKLLGYEI